MSLIIVYIFKIAVFHYDAQYQFSENFRVSPKVAFTLKN
jgi:hypothetical protein